MESLIRRSDAIFSDSRSAPSQRRRSRSAKCHRNATSKNCLCNNAARSSAQRANRGTLGLCGGLIVTAGCDAGIRLQKDISSESVGKYILSRLLKRSGMYSSSMLTSNFRKKLRLSSNVRITTGCKWNHRINIPCFGTSHIKYAGQPVNSFDAHRLTSAIG